MGGQGNCVSNASVFKVLLDFAPRFLFFCFLQGAANSIESP